jgi:pSer/pThr/pTyr-binding forkhead associated (FHA) protein
MEKIPTLVGTSGHIEGEQFKLEYGKTLVVGRSRSADFSLRRIAKVANMADDERENDQDLRTVSGKHFEITMYNVESIEVVNLSPNGTYVDGKLVDKIILTDVAENTHDIRIGSSEVFRLQLKEQTEVAPVPEGGQAGSSEPQADGSAEKDEAEQPADEAGESKPDEQAEQKADENQEGS